MRFSLSTKLILSMAGMVFLTAVACCAVFLLIVNNQTREFEDRLSKIAIQPVTPPPASEIMDKVKTIVDNQDLSADAQLQQVRQALRNPNQNMDFDKVRQAAAESGFPISTRIRVDGPGGNPNLGAARLVDDSAYNIFTKPLFNSILVASAISVVFAVVLGLLLSRTVIRPLRQLETASERIANGNYTLEIKPEGRDDLGRLAISFNKMSRTLRQTEQKRKDLVANVSHELRTPLSSIQGYTEVLRDGLIEQPQKRDEIYGHILREVNHLNVLVNGMREWTNNEQALDHLSPETFSVTPAIQAVIDRFTPAATSREVALETEIPTPEPEVEADAEALNRILSNLLDNALRYTPEGGKIVIKATAERREKRVRFEVRDNGCGIPAEHLPFIFERFYRVDRSRDRKTGGSGLGLAIVRESVLAQGGDVLIESEVDKGTKVIFFLPLAGALRNKERHPARLATA